MNNPFKYEEVQIMFKHTAIIIFFFIIGLIVGKLLISTFDLFEKGKQIKELQQKYENMTIEYNQIHSNIEVLLNEQI